MPKLEPEPPDQTTLSDRLSGKILERAKVDQSRPRDWKTQPMTAAESFKRVAVAVAVVAAGSVALVVFHSTDWREAVLSEGTNKVAKTPEGQFRNVELKLAHDVSEAIALPGHSEPIIRETKASDYAGRIFIGVERRVVGDKSVCTVRDTLYEARSKLDDPGYRWDTPLATGEHGSVIELPCDALAPVTAEDRQSRVPYRNLAPAASPVSLEKSEKTYREREKQLTDIIELMPEARPEHRPIPVFADHVWACPSENAYQNQLGMPGDISCRVISRFTAPDLVEPILDRRSGFFKVRIDIGGGKIANFVVHKADAVFMPDFRSDGRVKRSTNCTAIPALDCS